MKINRQEISAAGVKIILREENKIIARASLYLLRNDMHEKPFGFLEDVFVEKQFRGQGYGEKITRAIIEEAKKRRCYKLICTSRFSNEKAHKLKKRISYMKCLDLRIMGMSLGWIWKGMKSRRLFISGRRGVFPNNL